MKIKYASRSKFLEPCKIAITEQYKQFQLNKRIQIELENTGFNKTIIITISSNDNVYFDTDWIKSDASWFPLRIKAVSTALFDLKYTGKYEITSADNLLTIFYL